MKIFYPFDLRKIVEGQELYNHIKVIKHAFSEKLRFNTPKYIGSQDGIEVSELANVFTDEYHAPEVYTAYVKNILVSPKVRGLPRYWAMFFLDYYLFNFISNAAKNNFQSDGVFDVVADNINFDYDKIKSNIIKISGKSVWLFNFGNLDHLLRETFPAILTLQELEEDFSEINFITSSLNLDIESLLLSLGVPKQNIIAIDGSKYWFEFEELIIPCFGSFGHLHTPTKYYIDLSRYLLEKIEKKDIDAPKYKRVYVSRKHAKMRRIVNEEILYDGLRQRGFYIIEPGDFSKEEQALLFSETEIIVGPHGMGIANSAFSRKLKLLLEIFQTNYNRVSYFRTAQWLNCYYAAYYVAPLDVKYCLNGDSYGDVLIDKNQFFKFLDERLNCLKEVEV